MHVELYSESVPVEFDDIELLVVNAARVSVDGQSKEWTERDSGLVNRLMRDMHGSPFEHITFGFRIQVPIFVERQWHTHRWSSFNEESARYTEYMPKFYVPNEMRKDTGKPMDYQYDNFSESNNQWLRSSMKIYYTECYNAYKSLLNEGVAKEHARMILPVGTYTKFIWTANFRSIANFLSLRMDPHAQKEIQDAAGKINDILCREIPNLMDRFNKNERKLLGGGDGRD